jgi:hypothetical protein
VGKRHLNAAHSFARGYDHWARSVSRTEVWPNAPQESFWAAAKVEFYDRYVPPTKATSKRPNSA